MNPARRMLLKCLPAGIVSLFVGGAKAVEAKKLTPAQATKIVEHQLDVTRRQVLAAQAANERWKLLERIADRIASFMPFTGYVGRYVLHGLESLWLTDRIMDLERQRFPLTTHGPTATLPEIDLSELVELISNNDLLALRDIVRILVHRQPCGPAVVNDMIEPGVNTPVRYKTQTYVKDFDVLREDHRQLAYVIGQLVYDLRAIPNIEHAPRLDLDVYVRREAYLLEVVGWETQLRDVAVEVFPFSLKPYHSSFARRAGFEAAVQAFETKYGRKPTNLAISNVEVKELCKWADWTLQLEEYMNAAGLTQGIRNAFHKEMGVRLEIFQYRDGSDNNSRLIG